MSSAKNHRIRSHRSYKNKVSTAEHFQSRQYVKAVQKKSMNEKSNFFAKLMGAFKKGDK
jgi:hypothetical protein